MKSKLSIFVVAGALAVAALSLGQGEVMNKNAPIQRMPVRAIPTAVKFNPPSFTVDTTPDADLRPTIQKHMLQVKNQGNRNTCSVFATNFCLEYLWAVDSLGMGSDLSEEYLNWAKNAANGTKTDGGFFSQIVKGYQMFGVYMTGLVPYKSSFDPNFKPANAYVQVAMKWKKAKPDFIKAWNPNFGASALQIDRTIAYLDKGIPVAGGFLWPNSLQFEKRAGLDVFKVPASRSQVFDGHSVAIVGYKRSNFFPGGGYFIIRNSWGKGWGEDGYAYMPFSYVKSYANDLLAFKF